MSRCHRRWLLFNFLFKSQHINVLSTVFWKPCYKLNISRSREKRKKRYLRFASLAYELALPYEHMTNLRSKIELWKFQFNTNMARTLSNRHFRDCWQIKLPLNPSFNYSKLIPTQFTLFALHICSAITKKHSLHSTLASNCWVSRLLIFIVSLTHELYCLIRSVNLLQRPKEFKEVWFNVKRSQAKPKIFIETNIPIDYGCRKIFWFSTFAAENWIPNLRTYFQHFSP